MQARPFVYLRKIRDVPPECGNQSDVSMETLAKKVGFVCKNGIRYNLIAELLDVVQNSRVSAKPHSGSVIWVRFQPHLQRDKRQIHLQMLYNQCIGLR